MFSQLNMGVVFFKKFSFLIIFVIFIISGYLYADTIFYKDGKVLKGKIIYIAINQIILRNNNGLRTTVSRYDIKDIFYDDKEKTFLKVGRYYFNKKNFQKALDYYKKALIENPHSRSARMAILKVREILFQKKRKNSLKKNSSESYKMREWISAQERLHPSFQNESSTTLYTNGEFGLSIKKKKDHYFYVQDVQEKSIASHHHIFVDDCIISINGQVTKGLSLDQISQLFYNNTKNQSLQIQREFFIFRRKPFFYEGDSAWIDARFKKRKNGFLVIFVKKGKQADLSGLKKNDLVVAIEQEPTLRMSIENFYMKLRGKKGSKVSLTILRHFLIPKVGKLG